MKPEDILAEARKQIEEHANGDPDEWWYANRYVFARLAYDERKTKTAIKKRLFDEGQPCHFCGKSFAQRKGMPLHRLDQSKGYSDGNCVLAHKECHEDHHHELLRKAEATEKPQDDASPILVKKSKRYDGSFLYWWDISPSLAERLDRYEAIEFVCSDSQVSCLVPVSYMKPLLTPERQTSRGAGHWGIKVLKEHEDELAIEPVKSKGDGDWIYLPVTCTEPEGED